MTDIKAHKFRKREKDRPVSLTFAATPEDIRMVEEMAEDLDVSRSEMMRRLIKFHYALYKL